MIEKPFLYFRAYLRDMRNLFKAVQHIDKDNSRFITMDELESAMNESIGITGDEARHERSYSKWIQIM
ncbi:unnamed protein product, partial [Brassica rapa]